MVTSLVARKDAGQIEVAQVLHSWAMKRRENYNTDGEYCEAAWVYVHTDDVTKAGPGDPRGVQVEVGQA